MGSENSRPEDGRSENGFARNIRSENGRSDNGRLENGRSDNVRSDNVRLENGRLENGRPERDHSENGRSENVFPGSNVPLISLISDDESNGDRTPIAVPPERGASNPEEDNAASSRHNIQWTPINSFPSSEANLWDWNRDYGPAATISEYHTHRIPSSSMLAAINDVQHSDNHRGSFHSISASPFREMSRLSSTPRPSTQNRLASIQRPAPAHLRESPNLFVSEQDFNDASNEIEHSPYEAQDQAPIVTPLERQSSRGYGSQLQTRDDEQASGDTCEAVPKKENVKLKKGSSLSLDNTMVRLGKHPNTDQDDASIPARQGKKAKREMLPPSQAKTPSAEATKERDAEFYRVELKRLKQNKQSRESKRESRAQELQAKERNKFTLINTKTSLQGLDFSLPIRSATASPAPSSIGESRRKGLVVLQPRQRPSKESASEFSLLSPPATTRGQQWRTPQSRQAVPRLSSSLNKLNQEVRLTRKELQLEEKHNKAGRIIQARLRELEGTELSEDGPEPSEDGTEVREEDFPASKNELSGDEPSDSIPSSIISDEDEPNDEWEARQLRYTLALQEAAARRRRREQRLRDQGQLVGSYPQYVGKRLPDNYCPPESDGEEASQEARSEARSDRGGREQIYHVVVETKLALPFKTAGQDPEHVLEE